MTADPSHRPTSPYADRFDAATYEEDDLVTVRVSTDPLDAAVVVAAPVFYRLLAIGQAYDLHILGSVLTWNQEQGLNATQCEALGRELAFVAEALNDPLLRAHLPDLRSIADRVARADSEVALVLDLET